MKEAFRQGTRFAFISLIPWSAIAFILSVFLTKITDVDRAQREQNVQQQDVVDENKTEEETKGSPSLSENITAKAVNHVAYTEE